MSRDKNHNSNQQCTPSPKSLQRIPQSLGSPTLRPGRSGRLQLPQMVDEAFSHSRAHPQGTEKAARINGKRESPGYKILVKNPNILLKYVKTVLSCKRGTSRPHRSTSQQCFPSTPASDGSSPLPCLQSTVFCVQRSWHPSFQAPAILAFWRPRYHGARRPQHSRRPPFPVPGVLASSVSRPSAFPVPSVPGARRPGVLASSVSRHPPSLASLAVAWRPPSWHPLLSIALQSTSVSISVKRLYLCLLPPVACCVN